MANKDLGHENVKIISYKKIMIFYLIIFKGH